MNKWIVRLEADEREQLKRFVRRGQAGAYKIRHANVLLAVDGSAAGPKLTNEQVAPHIRHRRADHRIATASVGGRRPGAGPRT